MLPIRDHSFDGDTQFPADPNGLLQQWNQIVLRRSQQTACDENLSRTTVAKYPEDLVADIWLQSIQGKKHLFLLFEPCLEPLLIRQMSRQQFLIAIQLIGHRALGYLESSLSSLLMD